MYKRTEIKGHIVVVKPVTEHIAETKLIFQPSLENMDNKTKPIEILNRKEGGLLISSLTDKTKGLFMSRTLLEQMSEVESGQEQLSNHNNLQCYASQLEEITVGVSKQEEIMGLLSGSEELVSQISEQAEVPDTPIHSQGLLHRSTQQLIAVTDQVQMTVEEVPCPLCKSQKVAKQNCDVEESLWQNWRQSEESPKIENCMKGQETDDKAFGQELQEFKIPELQTQELCDKDGVIFCDSTILSKADGGIIYWDLSDALGLYDNDDCGSTNQLSGCDEDHGIVHSHNTEKASVFSESVHLLKEYVGSEVFDDSAGTADYTMATLTISDLMAMVLSLVSDIHGEHSPSIDDCVCELETPVATKALLTTVSLEYLDIAQQKKKPPTIYDNFRVSSRSSLHILDFPDEVTHYLLSLFSLSELCQLVVPVCKRWRDMVYDPIHWQQLVVGELSVEHFTDCIRRAPLLKKLDLGSRDELNANETILFAWGCPQLSELNMAFCDSLDNCLLQIISDKCKHLRKINLDGCRFVNDESLKLLSRMPRLSCVNLSHCSLVQTEGVDILAKNLSCITELDIDGIPDIEDSAIFTLVEHHAGHMERLSVDGAELTDAAAKAITKFSSLVELKVSFALLFTDVALAHLKNMTLQVLKVKKGGDLSQGSLVDFFTASSLSSLHSLDLTECVQLHDDGIFAMVKACGHNLRHLQLCWCWNITDFGLEAIVNGCPRVETLEFVGLKRIEGYSLAQIPECLPRLVLLDLQQCNHVIDELVVELVRQLPQLIAYNYYGERFKSTTRASVPDLFPGLSK